MIRINLAPVETRRMPSVGLSLPSFNLGILFGLVYIVAVAGIGFYWYGLMSEEATLTADGLQQLDDAMVDVKAEWDDFPACETCTPVEIYRFTSNDGAHVVLTSPSAMRPLDPIIDELRVELMACSGPWIQQCVELP